MTSTNIDYVDTYFEFPQLVKIHDSPTYATLKIVKDQIKENTDRVTSDLVGRMYIHILLVLPPSKYATMTILPYVRHIHPRTFVIPVGTP